MSESKVEILEREVAELNAIIVPLEQRVIFLDEAVLLLQGELAVLKKILESGSNAVQEVEEPSVLEEGEEPKEIRAHHMITRRIKDVLESLYDEGVIDVFSGVAVFDVEKVIKNSPSLSDLYAEIVVECVQLSRESRRIPPEVYEQLGWLKYGKPRYILAMDLDV